MAVPLSLRWRVKSPGAAPLPLGARVSSVDRPGWQPAAKTVRGRAAAHAVAPSALRPRERASRSGVHRRPLATTSERGSRASHHYRFARTAAAEAWRHRLLLLPHGEGRAARGGEEGGKPARPLRAWPVEVTIATACTNALVILTRRPARFHPLFDGRAGDHRREHWPLDAGRQFCRWWRAADSRIRPRTFGP